MRVVPYVEIPSLETEVVKPTLDPIPVIAVSDFSDSQLERMSSVIASYNSNLSKLVAYTASLEAVIALQQEYLEKIKTILNEK